MTDPTSTPQRTADRYLLRRQIATGGMASVHLADDVVLDRPVALKILHRNFATDSSFVDRFRREAQAAGRLRHPNIVTIFDWGPFDDSYFIAMEYVEGLTLTEVLADEGALPTGRAAHIAGQIVEALDAAHHQGLVHRDIKPSNILLSAVSDRVKVTDFGIARAIKGHVDLTQAGMIVGTAAYLSPEQARGAPVDPRSDLYSLGVVLFEMVTGRRPFAADNPLAVAAHHVSTPPPRVRSVRATVPEALDDLIDRLLAKDPSDRYQSTTELALDLRRIESAATTNAGGSRPSDVDPDATPTAVMDVGDTRRVVVEGSGGPLPATEIMPPSARPDGGPFPERTVDRPQGQRTSSGLPIIAGAIAIVGLVALLVVAVPWIGARDTGEPTDTTSSTAPGADPATPTSASDEPAATSVEIPDLVGQTQSEAEQAITGLGLAPQVDFEDVETDDSSVGRVLSQSPAAGNEIETGDTVVIVVGRAVETTEPVDDPSTTTTVETTTSQATPSTDTTAPGPSPTPTSSG